MKLAVIPGDGIGQEVTAEALKVLRATGIEFDTTEYDLGTKRYLRNGELLTDEDLASLREHDAILLGAIGDPRSVPAGVLERGLLLKMRFALDHHVNLRPSKLYPGMTSPLANPGEIDFVVVREGTEGMYCGNGGGIRIDTPHEVANETSVNTRYGVERVVRDAFERANNRRKKLTLVHKTNVLVHAGGLWNRIFTEVGREFPEVETRYLHIDAAMITMVTDPQKLDVIVTERRLQYATASMFEAAGAPLGSHDVVVVKMGYLEPDLYAAQRGWTIALTPGGVDQDLVRLGHRRIDRPMVPFDAEAPRPERALLASSTARSLHGVG